MAIYGCNEGDSLVAPVNEVHDISIHLSGGFVANLDGKSLNELW